MAVKVIEARKPEKKRIRAAVYARVSTDHEDQENSLKNQITHYREVVGGNPDYELIEIYYDLGISGFKESRPGFQRMLEDARRHRFDLIITKSITRFARNTATVLNATRELKELGIGVFFELQNINTLTQAGELLMTVYAAFGQGESEEQSKLSRMAYERKFEAGIPVRHLDQSFGYRMEPDGTFVPDENAVWVKKIFELAVQDYTLANIADFMNKNGIPTVGGAKWTASTVQRILQSEIYKGDFIMQKYFNEGRKQKRNRGERKMFYVENDHEPIVSRELWQRAQDARKKRREYLDDAPEVKEVTEENYPYKDLLFCGHCGRPLYHRIYSEGNRIGWTCSGMTRFGKNFCDGVFVPDAVVQKWHPEQKIFIRKETDELGKVKYRYCNEKTFMRGKSGIKKKPKLPALTKENYPFLGHVKCRYCGHNLTRASNGEHVYWVCSGQKHYKSTFCKGVGYVPNEKLMKLGELTDDIFIGKEIIDGEESYGYTGKPLEYKTGHRRWQK